MTHVGQLEINNINPSSLIEKFEKNYECFIVADGTYWTIKAFNHRGQQVFEVKQIIWMERSIVEPNTTYFIHLVNYNFCINYTVSPYKWKHLEPNTDLILDAVSKHLNQRNSKWNLFSLWGFLNGECY